MASEKYNLDKKDLKKIGKGAAIAFGAAALVSVSSWLSAGDVSLNTFLTLCIPAAVSTGINAAVKFFQGN